MKRRLPSFPSCLLVLLLGGCGGGGAAENGAGSPEAAPAPPAGEAVAGAAPAFVPQDPALIAANNRGVGLMGRYEYTPACDVFAELVNEHPTWYAAKVNLAIATFNRQEDGDEQTGLRLLEEVLAADPGNLRAHYCAGILKGRDGRDDEATEHFRVVVEADPADGYAAYFYAQSIEATDRETAAHYYEIAVEREPYLRSAYYRLASVSRLRGDADRAQALLEAFQRLEDNPRATTIKTIYTRLGPKAECTAVGLADAAPVPAPDGPVLLPPRSLIDDAGAIDWNPEPERVSITAADLDADGDLDLYVTDVLRHESANHAVLVNDGAGGFVLDVDHVLAAVLEVNGALWGDFDNDGLADVYLCRNGANHLWRQAAPGRWEDVTAAAGVAGDGLDTRDGAFFDADHDGDLDVFCANDGPNELFSNNGDGTFRAIAASSGIAGSTSSRRVVIADLDGSRDLDVLVINDAPPHAVHLNDRLWQYRAGEGFDALLDRPGVLEAIAADLDADGRVELVTAGAGDETRWTRGHDGAWVPEVLTDLGGAGRIAALDLDGSGRLAVIADRALGVPGSHLAWAPVLLEAGRGPSIVSVPAGGGAPRLHGPGPGRHPFLALDLRGLEDPGKELRSNAAGIGTRIAVRTGSQWTVMRRLRDGSGPGQSLQPVAIGLGGAAHADFVAIDWTDGTFQSEVHGAADGDGPSRSLAAGHLEPIVETQRQVSSCPVLFAWNGERFEFISDVLGVGGMGYLVEPGTYAPPRPWERFALPEGSIAARRGAYEIVLAEPMEEACYLDAAGLVAYDLPPGWHLALDERMSIAGPAPTGVALFYRHSVEPGSAVNERGEDVLAAVRDRDAVAAPVGPRDHRFIGRLEHEHVLTLFFAAPLDAVAGRPVLLADGWVEYPYSQTMFAAWQAGAEYRAPTLEAYADGGWHPVAPRFGYPAGMPREMALPLEGLPSGTTALRLSTNQEVYWDRLRVVYAEPCPEARIARLRPAAASLERIGFPRRTNGAQRHPRYDFQDRAPFWDTRHQRGFYTAFGPVIDLIEHRDDALAIFGPGEAVRIRAAAPAAPPAGWTRRVVLEVAGWCKDMDLYTRDGETLEPLPRAGAGEGPEVLHGRYNVRFESGR